MTYYFGTQPIVDDEIQFETDHFLFLQREQPVLKGSGIIIPKRRISTPFEFTPGEWSDLQRAMAEAKDLIDSSNRPDGYNIGWNVGRVAGQEVDHVHLHVIPRFSDEPMAGKGIRSHIKTEDNARKPVAQQDSATDAAAPHQSGWPLGFMMD